VHYDVVIAGGGTAGCVLAARLSEEPSRSVCLVEAGPDYGAFAEGRWPADIVDGRWLALDSHCWPTDRDDRSQLRARILGGGSSHNACVVLPGTRADYDAWGHGWSFVTLKPYLLRAERKLGTRLLERGELSPWHSAWAEATGDAAIVHPVNLRGTTRWNAAFAYLDDARERPNLTVRADTIVDRLLLGGDRATGVATPAGEIGAATVVLAAGAYGTPAILLRSGIGPGLAHDLPVGDGLHDHVGVGMAWEPTDPLEQRLRAFADSGGTVCMAQVTIRARDLGDVWFFPALDENAGGYEPSAAAFVMKPQSRGSVRLGDDRPETPLVIDHGFLADPRDAELLAAGFEELRQTARATEIVPFVGVETRPGVDVPALEHAVTSARGFFHPVATCALGRVADAHGRIFGIDGLVVGDASFIPEVPAANTNLTVAAVAERLAESF
jgi:choline dehydrogenase-like flavoprotein